MHLAEAAIKLKTPDTESIAEMKAAARPLHNFTDDGDGMAAWKIRHIGNYFIGTET